MIPTHASLSIEIIDAALAPAGMAAWIPQDNGAMFFELSREARRYKAVTTFRRFSALGHWWYRAWVGQNVLGLIVE